jgi:hypothetical protein
VAAGKIGLMLQGRLLTESLRIGAAITVPDLRVTRLGRQDVTDSTSPSQPNVWTFLDFEAPEDCAEELAAALAVALLTDDGWYADFSVGNDHVVVFADRVFRYWKGERQARAEAVSYGRAAGTPEHQLDWGE